MTILEFPEVDKMPKCCNDCFFFDNMLGMIDDACVLLRKRMTREHMYYSRYDGCPLKCDNKFSSKK